VFWIKAANNIYSHYLRGQLNFNKNFGEIGIFTALFAAELSESGGSAFTIAFTGTMTSSGHNQTI